MDVDRDGGREAACGARPTLGCSSISGNNVNVAGPNEYAGSIDILRDANPGPMEGEPETGLLLPDGDPGLECASEDDEKKNGREEAGNGVHEVDKWGRLARRVDAAGGGAESDIGAMAGAEAWE
jgi:hypothetical protein